MKNNKYNKTVWTNLPMDKWDYLQLETVFQNSIFIF